jgi:hypothetical protein
MAKKRTTKEAAAHEARIEAIAEADEQQYREELAAEQAAGVTAVFIKPETVTPANRRGASTVDNPVGVTWVLCMNATAAAGSMPERKHLHKIVMEAGVAYYTARTQVQAYRKWVAAGSDPTQGLPRGVTIG